MTLLSYSPVILLFVLFILRVPIALALLISTAVYFGFVNNFMPQEMMIQTMIASMESFPYLAIPFFTCAGVVFNYAGITTRLMKLAELLIGHMRGGMAQVNVLLSAMMGGVSGSANADAAMQTKMIVPQMERLGYNRAFSTVVTAASACITPIIPPGIILILYALVADVSVARMFMAGLLPGLMLTVILMLTVSIVSRFKGYAASRDSRASLREIGVQLVRSIGALLLPLGIIMGLRFGVFTPTEAGAIAVVYAVFVGTFVYRELRWKDLVPIIKESVLVTAGVMFIICAANAFAAYLTWEGIPAAFSNMLLDSIHNPIIFLLVVNLLLLFIGMFFEGGSAIILMTPLLLPVANEMGIDPAHFGIVMAVNLTIAGFTPPVGTMMFITISIAKVRIEEYVRQAWPFLLALIIALLLLTLIPAISLLLPKVLL
ncbi:TRAP transporter large permease [Vreelandella neptunia]|uniref:TRAP transporter large permease protein n=1 Tax=Vreelandella neptunia TaxID=115551 RepID=A0ABS9S365_9GAMM|nr:TRAP transporter large permease [Halomonas neptunia]MCH4810554.1 TRAP transporter large permease [Halomonas neptunia]